MNVKEIKEKTDKDLHSILSERREELRTLRFDLASGKVKNVRNVRVIKKDIARLLTELKMRAI